MLEAIQNPWPWYISGPLIGITVPMLLLLSGKSLGISSSFQYLCSAASSRGRHGKPANPISQKDRWKVIFALGMILGGFIAAHLLSAEPLKLFPESYHSVSGAAKLLAGGFLVGFGSRYAEGCTSGHAIFGLSSLQLASLVAVFGFFAGGLTAAGIAILVR